MVGSMVKSSAFMRSVESGCIFVDVALFWFFKC